MKNVAFFLILAVLTVAALVSVNVFKDKFPQLTRKANPTPTPNAASLTPTPTGTEGTALRNFGGATYPGGPTTGPLPAGSDTTKGGLPLPTLSGASPTPGPTAKTTPGSTPTPYPTTASNPTQNNEPKVAYTNSGFSPATLTVKTGTMVVFKNESNRSMKVGGGGWEQSIFVGNGGLYQYQFNSAGTYSYKDLNNTSYTGTVVVTQ